LQSFPEGFQFSGAMNAAFRQIGNAVSPLFSFAVAKKVRRKPKQFLGIASNKANQHFFGKFWPSVAANCGSSNYN
jgi:hypothetical protein